MPVVSADPVVSELPETLHRLVGGTVEHEPRRVHVRGRLLDRPRGDQRTGVRRRRVRPGVGQDDRPLGVLADPHDHPVGAHLEGAAQGEEAARSAIERTVAKPLHMGLEEAAYAIHRVVNANMARAAKVHCLEQGKDPREFALFAYGGAGPVHAHGVAQLLGIRELVYPLRAGVMSALGFLVAEPAFEVLRGRIGALLDNDLTAINEMLAEISEMETLIRPSLSGEELAAVELPHLERWIEKP